MEKKVYVGLTFKSLVVLDGQGSILEEIKITNPLDVLKEGLTNEEKEIENKFKDANIFYLFEKEGRPFEDRKDLISVVLERNKKYLEDIKANYKEYVIQKAKEYLGKDKQIILLFDALNHYEKIINEHVIRIRELGVYVYPGLYEQYKSNTDFIEDLSKENLRYLPIMPPLIDDESYKEMIHKLSKNANDLIRLKEKIEKMIEQKTKEIMPNTSYLIGEKLAAHLLSEMGGLEKLAYAPSSTIQVVGAEKSLFLHLIGKGKPPKHGIIFLSEYIQRAPKKHRGKVARILALKISKAAKIDYFSKGKEFKGKEIKKELDEALSKIL